MNAERAIYERDDPEARAAADARAEADIAAGRIVDHADVAAWLATWGTPAEKPAPLRWGARLHSRHSPQRAVPGLMRTG